MEKIISQTPYFIIYFDAEKHLFRNQWLPKSEDLDKEQIMTSVFELVQRMKEYKPIKVLADDRERLFAFDVDIQHWVGNTVAAACAEVGVKKYALILPEDLIAQISTEQTVEEILSLPFEFSYFQEEKKALDWLMK